MNTFLIATRNEHKLTEISRMLLPMGFNIIGTETLPAPLPEVEETGATFEENALIKARSAFDATGIPAIADDSGLVVDALNGEPGVFSARYAGEHGNDKKNNEKLLKRLSGVRESERTARYVCAVCCYFSPDDRFTVTGTCEGKIGFSPQGTNGFGYDPLFISALGCFGLIPAGEKDKISHRRKALAAMAEKLRERERWIKR